MSTSQNIAVFVAVFGPSVLLAVWLWWMNRRMNRYREHLRQGRAPKPPRDW